jgi:hypothetical protein
VRLSGGGTIELEGWLPAQVNAGFFTTSTT